MILALGKLSKLVLVMKVRVPCGPNGPAGMTVLLTVMVALEQESEDVSMEQLEKPMVAPDHPRMKSNVICNHAHVK